MKKFITYYRVSTKRQGQSGLGLDSQRSIVSDYINKNGGEVLNSYTEIESGKNDSRPELLSAIEQCKKSGATLLVAKLDRLARSVYFISSLQHSNIDFICCDFPGANKMTISIIASIAEYERDLISSRTKSALKVLKDKGVKLGSPNATFTDEMRQSSLNKRKDKSLNNENNIRAIAYIKSNMNNMTLTELTKSLNDNRYYTTTGKEFRVSSVYKIVNSIKYPSHLTASNVLNYI